MTTTGDQGVSLELLKQMADNAGLGLTQQELEQLKPIYDLYLPYINQLRSIDYQAEEIALAFQPDWPS